MISQKYQNLNICIFHYSIWNEKVRGLMVIVLGNGYSDPNTKPFAFHFYANDLWKDMNPSVLSPAMNK